jgi:hypothetical protein
MGKEVLEVCCLGDVFGGEDLLAAGLDGADEEGWVRWDKAMLDE